MEKNLKVKNKYFYIFQIQGIPRGLAPEAETLDTAEPIGSALAGACERLQRIPRVGKNVELLDFLKIIFKNF